MSTTFQTGMKKRNNSLLEKGENTDVSISNSYGSIAAKDIKIESTEYVTNTAKDLYLDVGSLSSKDKKEIGVPTCCQGSFNWWVLFTTWLIITIIVPAVLISLSLGGNKGKNASVLLIIGGSLGKNKSTYLYIYLYL